MLKNFKSERERLEKEINNLKSKNKTGVYTEQIRIKNGKLTQLNECEEMIKEIIENRRKELRKILNGVGVPTYIQVYLTERNMELEELKQNLFGGNRWKQKMNY